MSHDQSTSVQRTYRYLRIAIAGSVVVVFTAIGVAAQGVGVLPSISHYYYTSANTVFVGALIAVSVSFFSLSGRGAERVLLDAAAVLVPLVAIVPTTIAPSSVPGIDTTCAEGARVCVPAAYSAAVDTGVLTYLIVGVLTLVLAATLVLVGEVDRAGTLLSITFAAVVLAVVGFSWWLARDAFLLWAHAAAAVGFFAIIAAVALWAVFAPGAPGAPRWLRGTYTAIAGALVVVVAGMPLYGGLRVGPVYGVLAGEVAALLLFATFWVLQSLQYWRLDDPSIFRAALPPVAGSLGR